MAWTINQHVGFYICSFTVTELMDGALPSLSFEVPFPPLWDLPSSLLCLGDYDIPCRPRRW